MTQIEPKTTLTEGFVDTFGEDVPAGQVIGRSGPSGVYRGGADVEGVISSDHGALRIEPLLKPGWGRSGLAYGPYRRENGLAFGVHVLNGHNTSQVGDLTESLIQRLYRWAAGSESKSAVPRRMLAWSRNGHKRRSWRQFRRWAYLNRHYRHVENGLLDENLAVGWFPVERPENPLTGGNAFVVHATGAENGELWTRAGERPLPVVRGLQNVPVYYVVILRERGAAYYAASLPAARGFGDFPAMRPLAVDAFADEPEVYAGIYQSVLGQIGFRVDSRVYSTAVQKLPACAAWFGTAHLADSLTGSGPLAGSRAEIGGAWRVYQGEFARSPQGIRPLAAENLAALTGEAPAGLVHAVVDQAMDGEAETAVELVWRLQDEANYWSLTVDAHACLLLRREDGRVLEVARDEPGLQVGQANALQILDDGEEIAAFVNGRLLFNKRIADQTLQNAAGVGLRLTAEKAARVRYLEAHPRTVPIPPELQFAPPWEPGETAVVVHEDFHGPDGDLHGRATPGARTWQKSYGLGHISIQDRAAKVIASPSSPNPGRTIYTIPWDDPAFAELEVAVEPPGTSRGQWESGRAGVVFWQDAD
ncbi:MAG: hypothetical protein KC441_10990, partial [Anaerolineales bacterium]|nr:hypothetical protein [Anaerolineales bacterium]